MLLAVNVMITIPTMKISLKHKKVLWRMETFYDSFPNTTKIILNGRQFSRVGIHTQKELYISIQFKSYFS